MTPASLFGTWRAQWLNPFKSQLLLLAAILGQPEDRMWITVGVLLPFGYSFGSLWTAVSGGSKMHGIGL